MAYPLNYTFTARTADGNVIKGDVIASPSLKGDTGAGTDLAAQLEQNQAYRIHIPLAACGALGQTIRISADVANGAMVTNGAAIEAVIYKNVPESEQLLYFNNKFGFGKQAAQHAGIPLSGIDRQESVFSKIGATGNLSGDARFVMTSNGTDTFIVITPNATDVIMIRRGARVGFLGDNA